MCQRVKFTNAQDAKRKPALAALNRVTTKRMGSFLFGRGEVDGITRKSAIGTNDETAACFDYSATSGNHNLRSVKFDSLSNP